MNVNIVDFNEMKMFHDLIKNQFDYGGKKYALTNERESTDELFYRHGKNWLFGTMDKYTFRFKNLERERDLLKIGCYCYILWLKKGFHIKESGLIDVLDTTVSVKSKYYTEFLKKFESTVKMWADTPSSFEMNSCLNNLEDEPHKIPSISLQLRDWSNGQWTEIQEAQIFKVYFLCFLIWFEKYAQATTHDTDTENEQNTKK